MFICYIDEAGDDGYPNRSSDLFAFSMMYMYHESWRANLELIRTCRREIREHIGLPVKMEFHTKNFLLDKNPYRALDLSNGQKKDTLRMLLKLISQLDVKFVNVAIDKKAIHKPTYDVFTTALTYGIQRIHNDLKRNHDSAKFIIITDEGRLPKTVYTARKMQAFNNVPSRRGGVYRDNVLTMIEDPLPKASSESWFIQLSDLVVTIVYYYKLLERRIGVLPGRMSGLLDQESFRKMLEVIKPKLNLQAAGDCNYGIVTYPK